MGRTPEPRARHARHRARVPPPAAFARAVRDLGRLVLPVECAGCGRLDEVLCARCLALLTGPPRRCERYAPRLDRMDGRDPLPVWALTPYAGPVRELVVAWKDRGRVDVTRALAGALAAGAADVACALLAAGVASDRSPAALLVVPAPSSAAARRRRGADLVGELAVAVAGACSGAGLTARAAPVLAQRRGVRDQAGLGARARGRNLGDRVRWRGRAPGPAPGQAVLLVDDVLTTGATLAACEREVERAGGVVVGALTLAVTPPPGGFGAGVPKVPPIGRVDGWSAVPGGVTVESRSQYGPPGRDAVVPPGAARSQEEVMSPDRP